MGENRRVRNTVNCFRAASLLGLTVAIAGCGCASQVPTHKVSGQVTFKGKPLTTGVVVFHHADDRMPMAKGDIQSDGSFALSTYRPGDGAAAGSYQVTVHAFTPGHGVEGQDADYRPPQPIVPVKYTRIDQTTLTATVEPRENVINLDVKP
jgi:hypothetical protein